MTAGLSAPQREEQVVRSAAPAARSLALVLAAEARAIKNAANRYLSTLAPDTLHELRVALRRTRAAVKLAGDTLPSDLVAGFAPDLRWLAAATGPVRDLDVGLEQLGDVESLQAYRLHLRGRRVAEVEALRTVLTSVRYAALLEAWPQALGEAAGTSGGPTTATLARERTAKAWRRVVRQGAAITADTGAEPLHELRKRCKELRYLLELFAPVHDAEHRRRVVASLKVLQDVLGVFQDSEVQAGHVRDFASTSAVGDRARASLTQYAATLTDRQHEARAKYATAFEQFTRPKITRSMRALLAA